MDHDYYSLLGVDRFASQETLRRAYRSRIMAVHPDHNAGSAVACEHTRLIIEAYHVLSNPMGRRVYDLAIFQPTEPRHIVTRPRHREFGCPQWATRFCVVMVFLAMVAAAVFGVHSYLDSRAMVFRPQLGVVDITPHRDAPSLLGRTITPNANDARVDRFGLASTVVRRVCLDTAAYADRETRSHIELFATVTPPASF